MTVTANDRTAEGYQFGGWYVDSMNASLDDAAAMEAHFTMPDADVTLTATYNAIQTDAPETQTETAVQTEAPVSYTHLDVYKRQELDPTDMAGLQQLIDAKRRLQELKKLHISL